MRHFRQCCRHALRRENRTENQQHICFGRTVRFLLNLKQEENIPESSLPGRYLLYNPRQEHWDASRPGEMDYQVNWELEHLEKADLIIMNILPGSKSPITLLELGLFARSGKLLVVCTPEFYRYDNVRITCDRYGVPVYSTLEEMFAAI